MLFVAEPVPQTTRSSRRWYWTASKMRDRCIDVRSSSLFTRKFPAGIFGSFQTLSSDAFIQLFAGTPQPVPARWPFSGLLQRIQTCPLIVAGLCRMRVPGASSPCWN